MTWRKAGTMEYPESIHSFRRTDWRLPMIKDGEWDRTLSSISYWNTILFTGRIKGTMESCGTWITIVLMWFKRWEELREYWNTLCLKAPTSQPGRACSGKRPPGSKNPWNSRSWHMHNDRDWIRFQTEDSRFGGVPPLTVPTSTLASKFNWTSLESLCTGKYRHSRFHSFRYLERIYGRKFTKALWWTCVRSLT